MSLTTVASTGIDPQKYFDSLLLARALPKLPFDMVTTKEKAKSLPSNSGNLISFRKMEALAINLTPLTAGVTPTASSLVMSEVTVQPTQHGNHVITTDEVQLLHTDPVANEGSKVLGENSGQTRNALIRAVAVTGTNVIYQGTDTARNTLTDAKKMTHADVREAVVNLESNDALPFDGTRGEDGFGGLYMGIIHPRVYDDLIGDAKITDYLKYSDPTGFKNYSLPVVAGVAWLKSTTAPIFAGAGSGGDNVYGTLLFGKEAIGSPNIGGTGKSTMYVKPLGSSGADDPLNQRASMGWKGWHATLILNNSFFVRIETGATNG
jgi:N4-gp56 family major capsid protein